MYGGRIVAERYAPHFDATTPLIGWSMAKTAINALTGMLVQDGTVKLTDKALLPEWQRDEDPRREITLDQLLRMTSGLEFNEDYADESSDAIQMLFVQGDTRDSLRQSRLRAPQAPIGTIQEGPPTSLR